MLMNARIYYVHARYSRKNADWDNWRLLQEFGKPRIHVGAGYGQS
jgi:hypothetical protein